jgi:hypothetical protein
MVFAELQKLKSVYKAAARPIDTDVFWKDIIRNKATFPTFHLILRMCLALTPSNAVVEQAFSRLSRLLDSQRLRNKRLYACYL